jgi:hypothetical protein
MAALPEIFMLEWWLANNFVSVLHNTAANVYRIRDPRTCNPDGSPATPRIDVIPTVNGLANQGKHSQPVAGKGQIFDAWQGELQTDIVTNREVSEASTPPMHDGILGNVRSILYQFRFNGMGTLIPAWDNTSLLLVDIRETGSENSFDNEHNIDTTSIKWFILFQVNPSRWSN